MSRIIRLGMPVLLVALLIVAAIYGPRACRRAPDEATMTKVDNARTGAVVDAAIEAAAGTAKAMTEAADIDATTKENDRAIRSTPGADAPVPAAVNDAGMRALCVRASYRDQPRCIALLGPRAGAALR